MSRLLSDLSPMMQEKVGEWRKQMEAAGIDFIITCTGRTQKEQDALYEQGRTTKGKIVTWTHNSKHILGLAFDFVVMVNGKPDFDMHDKDAWDRAVEIGKGLGLKQVIGKDGKVKEFAHLEL